MTNPERRVARPAIAGLLAAALLALAACASLESAPPASTAQAADARQPITLLVSIDGFRSDYLQRGVSPMLSQLAAGGVTGVMHPSFPSKTFPNHWTLVTGLRPDRHGIVGNKMEAPDRKAFTMATDDPWWWNAAPPVWVDAEKAGIRTAAMFWPGASVAFGAAEDKTGGTRPADWTPYNETVNDTQRVNTVLDWLRRPPEIRPKFVTLYFDEVDTAGHEHGPDSAELNQAVSRVDAAVAMLVAGLKSLGQPTDLVIVADHGMAATRVERTIALDALLDPRLYHLVETGTYASLVPTAGKEAEVEKTLLAPHEHMQCWRKSDIPARFHYGANPRVPPILCLAEPGWLVLASTPRKRDVGGNHGYDNMAPEMNALFIANGPAFASGALLPDFDNVDVYPLLRDLIGLPAATGVDGSDAVFRGILKTPAQRP